MESEIVIYPFGEIDGLWAAVLGLLASSVATGISAFAHHTASETKDREKLTEVDLSSPEEDPRLREAKDMLRLEKKVAKWNGVAAQALTFSQYIIGGVLATSFVQESLSSQVVGFLGVLVLFSSLVHQHYRPDISARAASERAIRLKDIIRRAEDAVLEIMAGSENAPQIELVRRSITARLAEIDQIYLSNLIDTETDATPQ